MQFIRWQTSGVVFMHAMFLGSGHMLMCLWSLYTCLCPIMHFPHVLKAQSRISAWRDWTEGECPVMFVNVYFWWNVYVGKHQGSFSRIYYAFKVSSYLRVYMWLFQSRLCPTMHFPHAESHQLESVYREIELKENVMWCLSTYIFGEIYTLTNIRGRFHAWYVFRVWS